jgi:fido (protein-threonine AMPylation protein)
MTDHNEPTGAPAYPEWHPHDDLRYDEVMSPASAAELQALKDGTSDERKAFLLDTRAVHQRLYEHLTPVDYPIYAGTYRGTVDTPLEHRTVVGRRVSDETVMKFVDANKVQKSLKQLEAYLTQTLSQPMTRQLALDTATKAFYFFGLTHPYLDGNGHIQRLMVAAVVMECGVFDLLPTWTIHPRPYDVEVALAFEAPTTLERLRALQGHLEAHLVDKT